MKQHVDMATATKLVDTVRVLTVAGSTKHDDPDGARHFTVRTKAFHAVVSFPPGECHRFQVRIVVADRDVFQAQVMGPRLMHVDQFRRGAWEKIVLMSSPIDKSAGHA